MKKPGRSAISLVCITALAISLGLLAGCDDGSSGDSYGSSERTITVFNPSASGTYTVDNNGLYLNIYVSSFEDNSYVCDGPSGEMILIISNLDATQMTLLYFDDDEETTWTRDPGTPGDIVGEWEMINEYDETWTMIFNDDDTVSIQLAGSIVCDVIVDDGGG